MIPENATAMDLFTKLRFKNYEKHKLKIKMNIYKEVSHLIGLNCGRVGVTLLHK